MVDRTETTEREPCDRASLVVKRAENCGWLKFISPHGRDQLLATIRIALDTEVEAGGPYTTTFVISQ
jgi:hypothetical protein